MADEENKKSIVVASDDECPCDDTEAADQETELSSILDKLSLEPKKEKQKKKLLVLSLSGLLLHRVHQRTNRKTPKNRSPDASCGPNLGNLFLLISNFIIFNLLIIFVLFSV